MKKIQIRILENQTKKQIHSELQKLQVSEEGIRIMLPKAFHRVLKIEHVTATEANILKQEMLSIGGDIALPWKCVSGGKKLYTGILFATDAQIQSLLKKLLRQPLRLKEVAQSIAHSMKSVMTDSFIVPMSCSKLVLGKRTHVMAVINRTPDSFSDGGLFYDEDSCVRRIYESIEQGADIIDIGGESTRPGSKSISVKEELKRVLPIVKRIAKKINVPISIDTTKSEVAKACIQEGAQIINDISAFHKDSKMPKVIAQSKTACILMHCKGIPKTMQKNPTYSSVIDDIIQYLDCAIERAEQEGIDSKKIIVDPGIGFGKQLGHNIAIMRGLKDFSVLAKPLLVGTSRKSFIGQLLDAPVDQRVFGTAATVALAVAQGAHIVRVHDIREMKQVVTIVDAITKS